MSRARVLLAVFALACGAAGARAEDYLGREEFLALVFGAAAPVQETLWLTAALREQAQARIGLAPANLRMRYWRGGERTAWILEEIGKEQPITMGVAVRAGTIEQLRVLSFRESRGWEIRYPFFTDQFRGTALGADGSLDRRIDGITGATLSVRATDRVARLALWLDQQTLPHAAPH